MRTREKNKESEKEEGGASRAAAELASSTLFDLQSNRSIATFFLLPSQLCEDAPKADGAHKETGERRQGISKASLSARVIFSPLHGRQLTYYY